MVMSKENQSKDQQKFEVYRHGPNVHNHQSFQYEPLEKVF